MRVFGGICIESTGCIRRGTVPDGCVYVFRCPWNALSPWKHCNRHIQKAFFILMSSINFLTFISNGPGKVRPVPPLPPPPPLKYVAKQTQCESLTRKIIDERNDYPASFSVSRPLETCRQYFLLRTVILQKKKVIGYPWTKRFFALISKPLNFPACANNSHILQRQGLKIATRLSRNGPL